MTKKIVTLTLAAMLAAYVVANHERNGGGYEISGYEAEDGDYEDKSNEKEASTSQEIGGCGGNINNRNKPKSYEKKDTYNTRNHKVGYSTGASAAASADAAARSYERGHKDSVYM